LKFLLDVNVLLAAIHKSHPQHSKVSTWLNGKEVIVCPLCELGFIRISSEPKAMGVPMHHVRTALKTFCEEHKAEWIPDDLPGLTSKPQTSKQVTDHYLAELALTHSHRLATLDQGLKHSGVELIS
jgi:toxin-antitoxin system PIN domain toxin